MNDIELRKILPFLFERNKRAAVFLANTVKGSRVWTEDLGYWCESTMRGKDGGVIIPLLGGIRVILPESDGFKEETYQVSRFD